MNANLFRFWKGLDFYLGPDLFKVTFIHKVSILVTCIFFSSSLVISWIVVFIAGILAIKGILKYYNSYQFSEKFKPLFKQLFVALEDKDSEFINKFIIFYKSEMIFITARTISKII